MGLCLAALRAAGAPLSTSKFSMLSSIQFLSFFLGKISFSKIWPNKLSSRRKLKTWICLRLCLLARTCVLLRSLLSRSNLHASRRKFSPVWPLNPSERKFAVMAINLLANVIKGMSSGDVLKNFLFLFFCELHVLAKNPASPFGNPTHAGFYASSTFESIFKKKLKENTLEHWLGLKHYKSLLSTLNLAGLN